ncbi:MAG: outer membrane lipoprotein carrier protein LolA [Bacteroidetes bacterium]|nr:outer membrane lipoprotein carrier protein LolA [Bacteroidota bacterium]
MRKFIFILIIIFATTGLKAQVDKKAQTLLNELSVKYKKYKSIKAQFAYTLESKANKVKQTQKGVLHLKGNKFKVEVASKEIICDSKTVWTYSASENEVQINNYNPNENGFNPAQIFTMYEKGFIYKYVEEKLENGKTIAQIELTPTDKNKKFFKVKLFIDKIGKQIVRSCVFDKNGNVYTYEVQTFQGDVAVNDNFFTFDLAKHPNCEVNDLR